MKNITTHSNIDVPNFDELKALAEKDPQAFDALKKQLCEQVIQSASEEMQPRLRAQQSHIDRVVARCKNPIHTNVVLMNELQKQVAKFSDALNNPSAHKQEQEENNNTVVTFPPKDFY